MSKTIRVSDNLYEAIDDYRRKDQSFQDVIEEMAEEIGLLPARIQDAEDLQNKLQNLYGYNSEETSSVIEALRFVYIGQEQEQSIGVPHEFVDNKYRDEIDALKRLGLVKEKHYTGQYDYGYRTTVVGEEIGSELTRELLKERENQIEALLNSFESELLGVLIQFGFNKTDTGHLSDRGAELAGPRVSDLWDVQELQREYREFISSLTDLGIAVKYDPHTTSVVLPPEFRDYIQQRHSSDLATVISEIEIYQTILGYIKDNLENRDDVLDNLDTATEEELESKIEEFHQDGLTSRYLSGRDAPFLIKDQEEIRSRVAQEMQNLLGIPD